MKMSRLPLLSLPLTAALIGPLGGSLQAEPTWRSVARVEIQQGHRPLALGFDESHTAYWLQSRSGAEGELLGQIRSRPATPGAEATIVADGLPLKPGRSALLAWRGLCFLAAPPTIRVIDLDREGNSAVVRTADPVFAIGRGRTGAGFGGLSIAPDGRIYGSFSGGTVTGIEDAPGNQSGIFRFEPDASGFEMVHRGLVEPSAPMFDDLGGARLLDRLDAKGPGARRLSLLDSGFGSAGKPLDLEGIMLPEAASSGHGWLFTLARATPQSPPALAWHKLGSSAKGTPAPPAELLPEGSRVIDLSSDWNGVPHLLVSQPGTGDSPGMLEILRFAGPEEGPGAEDALAAVRNHFDDPQQEDGTALIDLISHPERRIRWQAAWAMSRRPDGLLMLEHAFGKGEALAQHAALASMGLVARRGAGAFVPGDDLEFGNLPMDDYGRVAVQKIAPQVTHPDSRIRVHALRVLGSARRPSGTIPFEKMLADPKQSVRDQTLLAAGRLKWKALVSSMKTARARGGGALDTARLADALAGIHEPAQLAVYSRQGDRQLRLAAVEVLRQHGHPALASFVFDPDAEVASNAVLAIDERHVEKGFTVVAKRLAQGPVDDWPQAARHAAKRCALRAER
jgi:hypothetical protein